MDMKNQTANFTMRALTGALLIAALPMLLSGCGPAAAKKTEAKAAPIAAPAKGQEVATLAAGCFWSMEAIFENLKGVSSVEPGYAGGKVKNPTYEQVCSSKTGHAETVDIIFDPQVITYRDLIEIMLTMRDPTTLNSQGPDEGPQYRSVIFYRNEAQKKDAQEAILEVTKKGTWKDPIVTKIEPYKNFFVAEDYHRDYFRKNPDASYCRIVIAPELKDLKKKFAAKVKE
jgi:peptide-methionine (S)-S-oxide reductase